MAAVALWQPAAHALTAEQALAMADGDNNSRIAAMQLEAVRHSLV